VMAAGLAFMGVLVIATGVFAVAYASEEKEHRDKELAEEEAHAAEEADGGGQEGAAPEAQSPSEPTPTTEDAPPGTGEEAQATQGAGAQSATPEVLDVTSPEDGGLSFEPSGLEAAAGQITLAYENPSTIPHNIALESEGETLEETDIITQDTVELSAELAPGEYIFFCAVPGHRQSGMEGTLTVQ
jgi:uncharacterized cupredoxin-like copper-binding protein